MLEQYSEIILIYLENLDSQNSPIYSGVFDRPLLECPSPSLKGVKIGVVRGAIVEYECPANFHLFGSSIRQCLSNGEWSGIEPVCLRKLNIHNWYKSGLSDI